MTNEKCDSICLRKDIQILQEEYEKLEKENKELKNKEDFLKNIIKNLKNIKKKSNFLIGFFFFISIFMSIFLVSFNGKIGTFVKESTAKYDELNSTSIVIKTDIIKSIDGKRYIRDSTPVLYGFLFFLSLIVLILFFEYKKYEAIKDE